MGKKNKVKEMTITLDGIDLQIILMSFQSVIQQTARSAIIRLEDGVTEENFDDIIKTGTIGIDHEMFNIAGTERGAISIKAISVDYDVRAKKRKN